MSVKRRLVALGHPGPERFQQEEETQYRGLVVWLEDQKIRHLAIDDRAPLRDVDAADWPAVFSRYLASLGCPALYSTPAQQLSWLLGIAVRVEFPDRPQPSPAPAPNTIPGLEPGSPAWRLGLDGVARQLQVDLHPDPLVTLHAVSKLVVGRLGPGAAPAPTGNPFPFREQKAGLGVPDSDPVLTEAVQIMRLMQVIM